MVKIMGCMSENDDRKKESECSICGADIDSDGCALEICGWSEEEACEECGSQPCTQDC